MVDLTIELGGRVCAALSVMVCGGRVHAQYMGGGGAGGGGEAAEALQVFPMAAVRGVGAAEDGCAALIELVHAGLGRALLLRVQRRAAAAGLKRSWSSSSSSEAGGNGVSNDAAIAAPTCSSSVRSTASS